MLKEYLKSIVNFKILKNKKKKKANESEVVNQSGSSDCAKYNCYVPGSGSSLLEMQNSLQLKNNIW